jgi:hypothetical protein
VPHDSAVSVPFEHRDRWLSVARIVFLVAALVAASPVRSWASPLVVSDAPTPCMASATEHRMLKQL